MLIVGLGLFDLLISAAGPAGAFQTLRHLGWLTRLVVLPYLTSYVLDTLAWWWVLSRIFVGPADAPLPMPSFGQLFALRAAGEAVNAITPAAYFGGEPVKAWLLSNRGLPMARGLASVVVSKTALLLTQGVFVLLGLLVALGRWQTAVPMWAAAAIGTSLALLVAVVVIGIQRYGLFGLLLSLFSRRLSGRESLLASGEAEVTALDGLLRDFYGARPGAFLLCCALMVLLQHHALRWMRERKGK